MAEQLVVAEFEVRGTPIPQGSMRAFNRKGGGQPIVTSDNPRTRPWKAAIIDGASQARKFTCHGPVAVGIRFGMPRPKGHYGARGILPSAPPSPATKPDIDKLVRAVLDALTEARVWVDDGQVVRLSVVKEWSETPGAQIRVVATQAETGGIGL